MKSFGMVRFAFARYSFLLWGLLSLPACVYPEAPKSNTVKSTKKLSDEKSEWIEMAPYYRMVQRAGSKDNTPMRQRVARHKNLLFVVADEVIQERLKDEISKIYKSDNVRLEDVLWWFYAPKIQKTYNKVLRLHWNGFNKLSLERSLRHMESLKEEYDVILLAHGIPNHLLGSKGQGLISWKDLSKLKNSLSYADALYLQACYGNTLAPDFKEAGFKTVIAYRELNWNFFYPEYFLDAMALKRGDALEAHDHTQKFFKFNFSMNLVHQQIIKKFFGDTRRGYLESVQLPEVY